MIDTSGQKRVTVKKSELLDVLRRNAEAHQNDYEVATKGWVRDAAETLSKAAEDARNGKVEGAYVSLGTKPESHAKDYARIIRMTEMSVDDTVTLDQGDFARFVMDDWEWKNQFLAATSKYTGK